MDIQVLLVYVPPIKESYLIAIKRITGYALCCSKNYAGFLILPRPLCLVGRPLAAHANRHQIQRVADLPPAG